MHRTYGFRNSSSPYVINSNLYNRILVTVRWFNLCRHIPPLFFISIPIPPVQNTCVGGIKSLFITSLRFCWIPKHFAPRPLSFPNLSCSLTPKKQAICWMLSVYVDTFHFSTTSITFSFHVLLFCF